MSCEPAAPPAAGGGASAAAGGGVVREADVAERALADIKPQEMLCGKCSAGSGGANCSEHGQVGVVCSCPAIVFYPYRYGAGYIWLTTGTLQE